MTAEHNDIASLLTFELQRQLPLADFTVRMNSTRARLPGGTNFVPDVIVIPTALILAARGTGNLEAYVEPLPLVVEVWSPSTGDYDVTDKLAGYRSRGDAEIWLIHPRTRVLTSWIREADGGYEERAISSGEILPVALPGVRVRLESLFR